MQPTFEQATLIRSCLQKGLHPAPFLPNFGITYDLDQAPGLIRSLVKKPVVSAAHYADLVCKTVGSDPQFADLLVRSHVFTWNFDTLSLTTVGNLAWMAVYGLEEHRDRYASRYKMYQEWLQRQMKQSFHLES